MNMAPNKVRHLLSSCYKSSTNDPVTAHKSVGVQVDILQPSSLPLSSTSRRSVSTQTVSDVNASIHQPISLPSSTTSQPSVPTTADLANSLCRMLSGTVFFDGESPKVVAQRMRERIEEETRREARLLFEEQEMVAMRAIFEKVRAQRHTLFANRARSGFAVPGSQIQVYTHDPDYEEAECSTLDACRGNNNQNPGLLNLNVCLGPVPNEGSSLFSSASFILIKGASDLCDRCCSHVEKQIRCGNGRVYNNFVNSDQDSTKMLLVNNGPLKEKASLILAISRGIQLLKIEYIKNMTLDMAPDINDFIVTKMYSVSKEEEITIYPRVMKKLLTNSVIAIACLCHVTDLNYVKDIIVALGGRYLDIFRQRVEGPVICVMSDVCCINIAKRFGHEFGTPAVGLKWLTQSVINNELSAFSLYHL